MSDPKIFVVVPTKNRPETVLHSLRTCLEQDYDNLEIIVSDNASGPETRTAIERLNDPRVRYQRSDKPLAMSANWEFGLSAVRDNGFVHFMGDDNGLLPGTLRRVANIARTTGTSAVGGQPVEYFWPGVAERSSTLEIPLPRNGVIADAERALRNVFRLRIGFGRLPNINSGFVHTDVIEMARSVSGGRYFAASAPDVYSCVINAMCVESFVYLNRAIAINGASKNSNGVTTGTEGKMTFTDDNLAGGYVYHRNFPPARGMYLGTYEPFAVAADHAKRSLGRNYHLDMCKVLQKAIYSEYLPMRRHWLKNEILRFAEINGLKAELPPLPPVPPPLSGAKQLISHVRDRLVIDGALHTFPTVWDAAEFAGKIIAQPDLLPSELTRISAREQARFFLMQRVLMGGKPFDERL